MPNTDTRPPSAVGPKVPPPGGAATHTSPAQWVAAAHVANVVWPTPGLCFRMVYSGTNGYPTRCPAPVRWRGLWRDPKGKRHEVDACEEHVADVDDRRALCEQLLSAGYP